MTTETRQFIEVSDIVGIELYCDNCKATLSFPIAGAKEREVSVCPSCKQRWFPVPEKDNPIAPEMLVVEIIKVLRSAGIRKDLHAHCRLQVSGLPQHD